MRRLEHRLGALLRAPVFWGLCAPSAQAVERNTLPLPDPPFKGKIGLRASDSVKDFPAEAKAPEGAPNVLLILTDDVGFGATSTIKIVDRYTLRKGGIKWGRVERVR